jgi:cytochrome c biogenesis factor
MTVLNNGENNSPAKDRLLRVESLLNEYQQRKGIIQLKVKNDVDIFINMSKEEMRRLTPEEACEAGIILTRYAAFIQDAYNIETGRIHWIDNEIRRTITQEMKQYAVRYQTFEERKQLAVMGNDYTAELDKLRMWAQATADRLSFMSNRIEMVAKAYMALAQIKRK